MTIISVLNLLIFDDESKVGFLSFCENVGFLRICENFFVSLAVLNQTLIPHECNEAISCARQTSVIRPYHQKNVNGPTHPKATSPVGTWTNGRSDEQPKKQTDGRTDERTNKRKNERFNLRLSVKIHPSSLSAPLGRSERCLLQSLRLQRSSALRVMNISPQLPLLPRAM